MQRREIVNQFKTWATYQVTAADLETPTGPIVTPEPISRARNRFDLGGESSDSEEEEIDFEYFDPKDPPSEPEPTGTATAADNNPNRTTSAAAPPGDPDPNGPGGGTATFDDDWILEEEFIMPEQGIVKELVKKYFLERWKTPLVQEGSPKVETVFRVQEAAGNVLREFEWTDSATGHASIIQEETAWLAITEGTAREETVLTPPPVWHPRLNPATHSGAQLSAWKSQNDEYNLYWRLNSEVINTYNGRSRITGMSSNHLTM